MAKKPSPREAAKLKAQRKREQVDLLRELKKQTYIGQQASRYNLPEGTVVQLRWLVPRFTYFGKSGKVVKQRRYAVATRVRWAFGTVKETWQDNAGAWFTHEVVDPVTGGVYQPRPVTVIRWPKGWTGSKNLADYSQQVTPQQNCQMAWRLPTSTDWHPLTGDRPSEKVGRAIFGVPVFVGAFHPDGTMMANIYSEPKELVHSGLWRLLAKGNRNVIHAGQTVSLITQGRTVREALASIPMQMVGWGATGLLAVKVFRQDGVDKPLQRVEQSFNFSQVNKPGHSPVGPGHDQLEPTRRNLESKILSQLDAEGIRTSSDATLDRLMADTTAEMMAKDISRSEHYSKWLAKRLDKGEPGEPQQFISKWSKPRYEKEYRLEGAGMVISALQDRKQRLRHANIELGVKLVFSHLAVTEDPDYMSQSRLDTELAKFHKRMREFRGSAKLSRSQALRIIAEAAKRVKGK